MLLTRTEFDPAEFVSTIERMGVSLHAVQGADGSLAVHRSLRWPINLFADEYWKEQITLAAREQAVARFLLARGK